jgi:hypothetical protein
MLRILELHVVDSGALTAFDASETIYGETVADNVLVADIHTGDELCRVLRLLCCPSTERFTLLVTHNDGASTAIHTYKRGEHLVTFVRAVLNN